MKLPVATLLTLAAVAVTGCQRPSASLRPDRQPDASGALTLVYEGEQMGGKVFPREIYLESAARERTRFEPEDPVSVEQSGFVIEPAWSPGNGWLVLPNGRFDGLLVFRTGELPRAVTDKSKGQLIGVRM